MDIMGTHTAERLYVHCTVKFVGVACRVLIATTGQEVQYLLQEVSCPFSPQQPPLYQTDHQGDPTMETSKPQLYMVITDILQLDNNEGNSLTFFSG